jgi:hypothetical protein
MTHHPKPRARLVTSPQREFDDGSSKRPYWRVWDARGEARVLGDSPRALCVAYELWIRQVKTVHRDEARTQVRPIRYAPHWLR